MRNRGEATAVVDDIPDVTALRLDEAIGVLKEKGFSFYLRKTASYGTAGAGPGECHAEIYRVVRQTPVGKEELELTIAAEACHK